jgi:hypothetical protein
MDRPSAGPGFAGGRAERRVRALVAARRRVGEPAGQKMDLGPREERPRSDVVCAGAQVYIKHQKVIRLNWDQRRCLSRKWLRKRAALSTDFF